MASYETNYYTWETTQEDYFYIQADDKYRWRQKNNTYTDVGVYGVLPENR